MEMSASDFVPRWLIRDYLVSRFKQSKSFSETFNCETHLINRKVISYQHKNNKFLVKDDIGIHHKFDVVIVATGVEIKDPMPFLNSSESYIRQPYPETLYLDKISSSKRVLILGSKLSAIDAAISIHEKNELTELHMVSPSGELPSVRDSLLIKDSLVTSPSSNNKIGNKEIELFFTITKKIIESTSYNKKENSVCSTLKEEIKQCLNNENKWQYEIADYIEYTNSIWPYLSADQKNSYKEDVKTFISRYVSSFPLCNAKKILKMMESGTLKIIKSSLDDCIDFDQNSIIGKGPLKGINFDLVINATGVISKPLPEQLRKIMINDGVKINKKGGVKVDVKSMKALTPKNNYNLYVIGSPAVDELLILNYIKSSVTQANKIGSDILRKVTINQKNLVEECI